MGLSALRPQRPPAIAARSRTGSSLLVPRVSTKSGDEAAVIDRALAWPVERSDQVAEYAPTQLIAEMFKQQGLDGIGYRSSLGPKHNIAPVDLDAADVIGGVVWSVDEIKVETSHAGTPYVVTKYQRKRKTKSSRSKNE